MQNLILYSGYIFVALGVMTLGIMAFFAFKMNREDSPERKNKIQRLIILNFAGIGLSIIGLMLLVLSSVF